MRYYFVSHENKKAKSSFIASSVDNVTRFRRLAESGEQVPGIAFNTYKSRYQEPDLSEGFSDVVKVNFIPHFKNQALREFYAMFMGG